MTSPSPNGTKIEMAKSVAVVRRSPFQRNGRITRPAKMSRIPLIHMKGKAAGSWMGMPKPVEAPTGLSMKLMPIAMKPSTTQVRTTEGNRHADTKARSVVRTRDCQRVRHDPRRGVRAFTPLADGALSRVTRFLRYRGIVDHE